ncbi:MAG: hypothetical protein Q7W30_08200 [Coriobacteriia bacterium]|nr:hypothetical protein [Coriobacteriia bacterium]
MYYQPSEIADLLVALFLTPVMWVGLRHIDLPGKRYFIAGYVAMLGAFSATIIEQNKAFAYFDLFNTVEHGAMAVAGVLFAFGAWRLLVAMRSRAAL